MSPCLKLWPSICAVVRSHSHTPRWATNLGDGGDVPGSKGGGGRGQEDERDEERQEPGAPLAAVEDGHGFAILWVLDAGCCGERECESCGVVDLAGVLCFLYVAVMQALMRPVRYLKRLRREIPPTPPTQQ